MTQQSFSVACLATSSVVTDISGGTAGTTLLAFASKDAALEPQRLEP
eukprot:CAMPEP_0171089420 /NCGR_PEP_ID=MMETSP0766_2-20121228/25180_1 /TAXON_ID=439317 /ORGANISM="Gambierdiscus australes, Strain CAWD 149" /LENGTH=46 /DNA_ID= /DNA_START= /DNA_END= /DNA_ORIENTATION=